MDKSLSDAYNLEKEERKKEKDQAKVEKRVKKKI